MGQEHSKEAVGKPRLFADWLAQEHAFWTVCSVLLGSFTALKGLRAPGAWALTQAQLDYSHGFVKRGLLGTVYGACNALHQRPLSIVFFVELALLLVLLTIFAMRSGMAKRFGSPAVIALFAGSYAVTFVVHLVGYTDIPNACIAIGLLLIRNQRLRFALAVPAFVVALLIHENFLLLFAPLVLLSFVLEAAVDTANSRRSLTFAGLLGALAVGVTLVTSLRPPMSDAQADALQDFLESRVDFASRDDFYQVLHIGLRGNLQMISAYGWHKYLWWTYLAVSICVLLPALLILLHLCRRVVRASTVPTGTWLSEKTLTIAVAIAIFSPLVLHLLGLDAVRWNSWVLVDAFLALGLLCMNLPGETLPLRASERNAIILAIAIGMASGHGLFDGETINPYPFFPKPLGDLILRHDGPLPGFQAPCDKSAAGGTK